MPIPFGAYQQFLPIHFQRCCITPAGNLTAQLNIQIYKATRGRRGVSVRKTACHRAVSGVLLWQESLKKVVQLRCGETVHNGQVCRPPGVQPCIPEESTLLVATPQASLPESPQKRVVRATEFWEAQSCGFPLGI